MTTGQRWGCIAQPGDTTVYPAGATAKRVDKGAKPFFSNLFSKWALKCEPCAVNYARQ